MIEWILIKYRKWLISQAVKHRILSRLIDEDKGILAECCQIAKVFYTKNINIITFQLKWLYGDKKMLANIYNVKTPIMELLEKRASKGEVTPTDFDFAGKTFDEPLDFEPEEKK